MEINSKIYNAMRGRNNMITTAEVVELGLSRMMLSKYVNAGLLLRVRQGIYALPSEVHDDMFSLMQRSQNIIFSHESSLFLNGLSDRTPFIHSITIPSNASLPKSLTGECNCYYVKKDLHPLGLSQCKTPFGNIVRCYNPERTICDIVRSRSRIDEETFVMAVRNYAKLPSKNLTLLTEYASQFKILKHIKQTFEIIL
jgi:predicted transcriptional regulator of viral defense system